MQPTINPDSTLKWKYGTEDEVWSSPAIGRDGTVYVGSSDEYLYAIGSDGYLQWRHETMGAIYSSPAIGDDRTIYVGSADSWLYAIGEPTATATRTASSVPESYRLHENFPNPFNPSTRIRFSLPTARHVTLRVFDMLGRPVETIADRPMSAGTHTFTFEGGDLPSGAYTYRLETDQYTQSRKMLLVK